jgi:hypothetical protein
MFLPPSRSLPMVALVLGCASYAEAFSALPLAANQDAVRRGSSGMCMSSEPSRRDALVVLGGGLLGAAVLGGRPEEAAALVKGTAPPSDYGKKGKVSHGLIYAGEPPCFASSATGSPVIN